MKKTITLLILASLSLISVQLYAEDTNEEKYATILVVYDKDRQTVSLAKDPNAQEKIYVRKINNKTYNIYYNIDRIFLKPHINGEKNSTQIIEKFLQKNIALEKNNSIKIYGIINNIPSEDNDRLPHQLACNTLKAKREDYIEIVEENPTCILQYDSASTEKKTRINIHFIKAKDESVPPKVICNFFSNNGNDSKMKNANGNEVPSFSPSPDGQNDSIIIDWKEIDHFELVRLDDSLSWSKYRVSLDSISLLPTEATGEICKYEFKKLEQTKGNRTLTIELDRFTVSGPQKYKATIVLVSPSSNYIWLYITCAVISLCLIAIGVYFIVKIIKKRITRGKGMGKIKGKGTDGNEEDSEIQELVNKILHRVRELKLENIHDSEQIERLKELEEHLKSNANQICVSFEDDSDTIQKIELIINELTKISNTIDAEFISNNLEITDTTGSDKLKKIFNVLEAQINKSKKSLKESEQKHKEELTQKQKEYQTKLRMLEIAIDMLKKEIDVLSQTIENTCKSITDSISAQLKDISNDATLIQEKQSSELIISTFKYIPSDITKMSEDISKISAKSINELNDNLLKVTQDNLIDNGWIDRILRLYTFSLYPDINVYFNEQGFDTTLLSELSMKIISLLGKVGITLNTPMLFTRFDDNRQKHATNEEYLKRYCREQQHIIEHINQLEAGYINDVLHIGYNIQSKQISVKATVNYKR